MAGPGAMAELGAPGIPGKCGECLGCILCGETQCIYYSDGNPGECYVEKCTYCHRFLRIQRLFLNNVG